jgi:hypothetical protein
LDSFIKPYFVFQASYHPFPLTTATSNLRSTFYATSYILLQSRNFRYVQHSPFLRSVFILLIVHRALIYRIRICKMNYHPECIKGNLKFIANTVHSSGVCEPPKDSRRLLKTSVSGCYLSERTGTLQYSKRVPFLTGPNFQCPRTSSPYGLLITPIE